MKCTLKLLGRRCTTVALFACFPESSCICPWISDGARTQVPDQPPRGSATCTLHHALWTCRGPGLEPRREHKRPHQKTFILLPEAAWFPCASFSAQSLNHIVFLCRKGGDKSLKLLSCWIFDSFFLDFCRGVSVCVCIFIALIKHGGTYYIFYITCKDELGSCP